MMMIFEGPMRSVEDAYRMAVYVVVWKPVYISEAGHDCGAEYVPSDRNIQAERKINRFGNFLISDGLIIPPTLFQP